MPYPRPHQTRFLLTLIAAGGEKHRSEFGITRIPDRTCADLGFITTYGGNLAITAAGREAVARKHPAKYDAAISRAIPPAVHVGPETAARIIAAARTSGQIQVFTCNMGGRA